MVDLILSLSRLRTMQHEGVVLKCQTGQWCSVPTGQSTLLFVVKLNTLSQHRDSAGVLYTHIKTCLHVSWCSTPNLISPRTYADLNLWPWLVLGGSSSLCKAHNVKLLVVKKAYLGQRLLHFHLQELSFRCVILYFNCCWLYKLFIKLSFLIRFICLLYLLP